MPRKKPTRWTRFVRRARTKLRSCGRRFSKWIAGSRPEYVRRVLEAEWIPTAEHQAELDAQAERRARILS
jgi:hypothetical protein